MDYKEEYQKALERAKEGLPIDEVFPELKESEEERIRKELIEAIERARVFDIDKEVADRWIAYLEKQKEQKPSEWSEEDENMLNGIIERGSSEIPKGECGLTPNQVAWLETRFKSLRPSWKPSEEQMKALLSILPVVKGSGDKIQDILESLYNDLEKLCYE